jgi:hypothetical protein
MRKAQRRRRARWALAPLAAAATALAVGAPALAAPTGFSDVSSKGNDQVVALDLGGSAAGTALPNPTGKPENTDDLKFSPAGTLFGMNDGGLTICQLVQINQTTGVATAVGVPTGVSCNVSGRPRIAFTPDGRLWLVLGGTHFFQVDTATGLVTAVGTLPTAVNGLVSNGCGQLLATTVDTTNGALVSFSPSNPTTLTTIGNLGIPTAGNNLALVGLDFAADGTLWALRQNVTAGAMESYRINPTTGAATLARANVMDINLGEGLGIAPPQSSCPTPPPPVVVAAPRFTG